MKINFNKNHVDKNLIEDVNNVFNYALEFLNIPCKDIEVNVTIVNSLKIKHINKKYRGVNKVTDVISFPYLLKPGETNMHLIADKLTKENFPFDIDPETNNILIGDLFVCFSKVKKQAKIFGTGLRREFTYLCLHGLLHLLGYDHILESDKKVMREAEENIMKILQN